MWYLTAFSHLSHLQYQIVSHCLAQKKEISACDKSVHMCSLHTVSATCNSEQYLSHCSLTHLAHRQRRAFKPTFVKGDLVSVSNIWKHLYFQLRSQPVEGGGDGLHTELDESLTEDDAGADQRDATRDGGDHDCQDQRCRHLALRTRALRSCYCPNTGDVVAGQDFIVVAEAEDKVSIFISFAALRLTVAAVQLYLDLTLAVTLHGCQRLKKNLSHRMNE